MQQGIAGVLEIPDCLGFLSLFQSGIADKNDQTYLLMKACRCLLLLLLLLLLHQLLMH